MAIKLSVVPDKLSSVVPANAGTHSRWRSIIYKMWLPDRAKPISRGVWVPAFAGTTRISIQPS